MKKFFVLGIVSFVIAVAVLLPACSFRESEPLKQRSFVPKNSKVARGEELYMAHCHKCHPAGEGGLGPSINIVPAPKFIKRFQMRHGVGVMPAFSKKELSRKDLHDISDYMSAWKRY